MAVERFPVEAGPHPDVRPQHRRPEPGVRRRRVRGRQSEVGGIPAPPTFVQASAQFDDDYPLRPKVGKPWFGSGKEPTGIRRDAAGVPSGGGGGGGGGGGTGLHAEQHYTYHRPLLAGRRAHRDDARRASGGRSRASARASSCSPRRSPSTATRQGELVVTARGVGVRTEKVVES